MKKCYLVYFFLSSFFLFACSSKEEPAFSLVPQISFQSVSASQILHGNSVDLIISYTDLDGDLGTENAQENNLHVKDMRNQVVYQFRFAPLAPVGASIAIEGNLRIAMPPLLILDEQADQETLTFEIYLKDRAGNWSNTVKTSPITVKRE